MGLIDGIYKRMYGMSKCERKGHNIGTYNRSGYYPGGFRSVVTQVKQQTKKCKRCGYQDGEWETIKEEGIQSFTASSDFTDKIDAHSEKNPFWYEYRWSR